MHFHFVGIGGIGMSGLAGIFIQAGYRVTGSDLKENAFTRKLKKMGASISQGHRGARVKNANLVVFSSAIGEDNPEIKEARRKRISLVSRGKLVAEISNLKESIVVAGTHGKTTTASLIAELLLEEGRDPTLLVGGILNRIQSNSRLGKSRWMIVESDESDGSFLLHHPSVGVVTNIEDDHLEYYGSKRDLLLAFYRFMEGVKSRGFLVLNLDDPPINHLVHTRNLKRKIFTYGIKNKSHIMARNIELSPLKSSFSVYYRTHLLGRVDVPLAGIHNVYNSLAAICAGLELGISWQRIKKTLSLFSGVKRRMEKVGEAGSIWIFDDYAHHPTEIKATIKEIRRLGRRILVIFQPHRYTRSRFFLPQFAEAFEEVDVLILTPIYSAGERPIEGVSEEVFFEAVSRRRKFPTYFFSSWKEILEFISENIKEKDLVITVGAGDITDLSTLILNHLRKKIR